MWLCIMHIIIIIIIILAHTTYAEYNVIAIIIK